MLGSLPNVYFQYCLVQVLENVVVFVKELAIIIISLKDISVSKLI